MSMKSNEQVGDQPLSPPTGASRALPADDHLADHDDNDPVSQLRERLEIPETIPDVTIAASLAAVSAKGEQRERWLAAFTSPLGKWLAMRGTDLNTALNVVISFAPKATS
jgi:hypothetical protein